MTMEQHPQYAPFSGSDFEQVALPSGQSIHNKTARAVINILLINNQSHCTKGGLDDEILTLFCEAQGYAYTRAPKDMGANSAFNCIFSSALIKKEYQYGSKRKL